MAIELSNSFQIASSIEDAWGLLTDIPVVALCLPGARIEGQPYKDVYTGDIGIKIGPISLQYHGTLEIEQQDDINHLITLKASGKDNRGNGNVSATIRMHAIAEGPVTNAEVNTSLEVSGKVAQFGAGAIQKVSDRMLDRFIVNLSTHLQQRATSPSARQRQFTCWDRESRIVFARASIGGFAITLGILGVMWAWRSGRLHQERRH